MSSERGRFELHFTIELECASTAASKHAGELLRGLNDAAMAAGVDVVEGPALRAAFKITTPVTEEIAGSPIKATYVSSARAAAPINLARPLLVRLARGQWWERVEAPAAMAYADGKFAPVAAATHDVVPQRVSVERIVPIAGAPTFGAAVDELDVAADADGFALCVDLDRPPAARAVRIPLRDFHPSAAKWSILDEPRSRYDE